MIEIRLCAGLLERDRAILLVASQYPNLAQPLWGLPGGRPRANELLEDALRREFREETGLEMTVEQLLYVSESFDPRGDAHVVSFTFRVAGAGEPRMPEADAHIVDLAWVPRGDIGDRINVAAVREPLLAHLAGDERRYYAFADAGTTIEFSDSP